MVGIFRTIEGALFERQIERAKQQYLIPILSSGARVTEACRDLGGPVQHRHKTYELHDVGTWYAFYQEIV